MTMNTPYRKKLIEVALPLDAINKASAREKSIRHGHPSTLHLWWARRPLAAAARAGDSSRRWFDAPSACPELFPTEADQERERQRLFRIIEELVKWENTTNEEVLERAREEIRQSWRRACADNADHPQAKELFDRSVLPAFHDPFAGGGSLPLEAQRLGLEAHASDLNPVAVLINKAMIEIPPRSSPGEPRSTPKPGRTTRWSTRNWKGAKGLAEDVRHYGRWMRDQAEKRIGHLYPKAKVTAEMTRERPDLKPYAGRELTVIAWLWARTVKSPNPAFAQVDVPLASTFMLSTKKGKEAYVHPVIEGRRLPLHRQNRHAARPRGGQSGHQALARRELPVPDVGNTDRRRLHQSRRARRAHGGAVDGDRRRGDRGRVYQSHQCRSMSPVAREAEPDWKTRHADIEVPLAPALVLAPTAGITASRPSVISSPPAS